MKGLKIASIKALAKLLASQIDEHAVLKSEFPACDFAIIDSDDSDNINDAARNASGWYGIKAFDAGFDSVNLCLIADYYGGGCAELCQIFDGMENAAEEIEKTILNTLTYQEAANADTMLLVDFDNPANCLSKILTIHEQDKLLEKLWESFADIPMNPDTEEMEEPFLYFPAGTHREEIWHWFDERYSSGVYSLLYPSQKPDKL